MRTFIANHRVYFHRLALAFAVIVVVGVLVYARYSAAATYTWDNGSGDGLWSTCTNWSSNLCPGASDIANFSSSTTSDSVIDGAYAGSVKGITIGSGYTGTITQQRSLTVGTNGYIQSTGTFNQGTSSMTNSDSVSVTGGVFTAASGTNSIANDLTIGVSATYSASSTRTWTFTGQGATTLTYPGTFPNAITSTKTYLNTLSYFTVASGTTIANGLNLTSNAADFIVNAGAIVNATSTGVNGRSLTISGTLYASSTIDLYSHLTLNAGGTLVNDATTMYVGGSYTDNGGTFNESGKTFVFDGVTATTFTVSGVFPGIVQLNKSYLNSLSYFTLATTSIITTSTSTITGAVDINIYGTLRTGGTKLQTPTGTLTVYSGGTLALYSTETITTPVLNSGSIVEYYGPGTYTTLNAGYSYSHVKFSAGTYNLAQNLAVAGDFTNTGSAFTQTSGTTTFSGATTAITGNNTFYNFSKNTGASSTITFGSGNTQTITGTLTLAGLNASNRLTLAPGTPGSQWYINPQGTRTISYLSVSYGNNSNATAVDCYTTNCVDGGNNTNFSFTAPQPSYRLKSGVRLRGGTRI